MTRRNNISGQRFGQLVAVECVGVNSHRSAIWKCKCDCGNYTNVIYSELMRKTRQGTQSCGCFRLNCQKTHGGRNTRLYHIWGGIKMRCNNPNYAAYPDYGGRGITLCDEWKDFVVFRNWANSNGYHENLQIDRIDNNKGYYPENCRWTTSLTNNNNRRSNIPITFNGKTQTLAEWARELDMDMVTLHKRLKHGWTIEATLSISIKPHHRVLTYNGQTRNLTEWAKFLGINASSLKERLDKWPMGRALSTHRRNDLGL